MNKRLSEMGVHHHWPEYKSDVLMENTLKN